MVFEKRKRVSLAGKSASLTVEAALGLTLFIFFTVCMMMPMEMLRTRQKVQTLLETTGRDLSQYSYVLYCLDQGDDTVLEKKALWQGELKEFLENLAVKVYLRERIQSMSGDKIENLSISEASVMEDGENIVLKAEYDLKLPFSVFHINRIPTEVQTIRRSWIGSEGERAELNGEEKKDEQMVFIGSSMGRYHRSKDCHYLSNDFYSVMYDQVEELRNHSGGIYTPCSRCGKKAGKGDTVYILPNGSHYHSSKECSSLVSYIRKVPLSTVEHLGECSYCGKGGKN